MRGHEAVQAQVAVWMGTELIDKREFAMAPGLGFWKDAFHERPRPFQVFLRELLRSRPTPPRSRIRREVLSVDPVSAMRPSNRPKPSSSDVNSQRLDVAPEAPSSFVQLHALQRRHFMNPGRFKVSETFLEGDCIDVKRHAPRWRALTS